MHKVFMKLTRLYLARRVRRRPPRPLTDLDLGGVRRVLLISATALGDTLFSTPAIRALKERYPAWELEVLAHRVFGALLAHNPHVGRIYTYPGRNRRLLTLARDLRLRAYDLVVILHGNDPEATLLAHLTGSPYIIGSAKSPLAFAYSATVAPTDPFEHAIERRLNYVRLLGADTADKRMDLWLPPGETDRAAAILTEKFRAGSLPGSWPSTPPARILINGGPRPPLSSWEIFCTSHIRRRSSSSAAKATRTRPRPSPPGFPAPAW